MADEPTPPGAGADGVMGLVDALVREATAYQYVPPWTGGVGGRRYDGIGQDQARAVLETAVRDLFARLVAAEAERDALRVVAGTVSRFATRAENGRLWLVDNGDMQRLRAALAPAGPEG